MIGFIFSFWRWSGGESAPPTPPPRPTNRVLAENGNRILAENGDYIAWE